MTGVFTLRNRRRRDARDAVTPVLRFPDRPSTSSSGFDVAERIAASVDSPHRDAA